MGPAFAEEAGRGAAMTGEVQDHVGGMAETQGFAREPSMRARLSRVSRALARREIAIRTLIGRFDPAVDGAMGPAIALVVWAGGTGLVSGRTEAADLVAVLLLVGAIDQPLHVVVSAAEATQKALAAMRRIEEVLATAPEIAQAPGAADPRPVRGAVAFGGVTFGHDPATPVLRELSVRVAPGEAVAVVGANGAGKSTIAALLSGFHDPREGRVTLDGRDLRDLALRPLRRSVARVGQDVFLLDATMREVVEMGREGATEGDIRAAPHAAEADGFVSALPLGLDARVGERGVRLSGGQKQRLSIARALLADAPVLVPDEATSADAATEARLQATLDRVLRGRTAIVIAHRLSTMRAADRILVLDAGRIVEAGPHAELMARAGRYAALTRTQLGDAAWGRSPLHRRLARGRRPCRRGENPPFAGCARVRRARRLRSRPRRRPRGPPMPRRMSSPHGGGAMARRHRARGVDLGRPPCAPASRWFSRGRPAARGMKREHGAV